MILDSINRVFVSAMLAAKREDGQTFVEYALIAALIAVVIVAGIATLSGSLSTALSHIGTALAG
jgi:Flp/Fap pilin component.